MLALLPALALATFVVACKARVPCWREAILGGAVLSGPALVTITEVLSVFHALTPPALAAAWLIALLPAVAFIQTRHAWPKPFKPRDPLRPLQLSITGPLALMLAVLGFIATSSPPNTWDAMTYHMARLIHWQQHASLAPYPTHILRQLYLQPGAEFVLLHLQLLSGGDHLAGLVQWTSMLGVLLGVSVIAGDLGAGRVGALLATVFAASIPIGVLESTSTQNDYVAAFWLVCVAVFGVRVARAHSIHWATVAAFGASLGLALLTKATAYIFAAPVLVWLAVPLVRRFGTRGIAVLLTAGAVAIAINATLYARNLAVFGSLIGPADEGLPSLRYANDAMTPVLLASNVVRDVGVNVIATPFVAINVRGVAVTQAIHDWLGVAIDDPRTTWGGERFAEQSAGLAFDENFASNPIHSLLLLVALAAVVPLRGALSPSVSSYALVLVGGFLLFAALLRWQPWHTRLELPLFVLGAALVGIVVERVSSRVAVLLCWVLLVSMVPWVLYNQARPLVGPRSILSVSRDDQYFANRPDMRAPYLRALNLLAARGCNRVGFISTGDGWEYPLWALHRASGSGGLEIEHVGVGNASASQRGGLADQFDLCAVLSLEPTISRTSLQLNDQTYRPVWAQGDIAVMTVDSQ